MTVDWSYTPGVEGWSGKVSWERIWWQDRGWGVVVLREEIRILVPPKGRHRLKMRIIELPAVPWSSFSERRYLEVVIVVKMETRTVTLGTANQLVHVTGLYPEVRLVRVHSPGHEFLERRRENPQLLTTVFRGDDLQWDSVMVLITLL